MKRLHVPWLWNNKRLMSNRLLELLEQTEGWDAMLTRRVWLTQLAAVRGFTQSADLSPIYDKTRGFR